MPDKDYKNKYFILWRWYKAYLFSLQPIINSIIHGIVPVNDIQDGIKMRKSDGLTHSSIGLGVANNFYFEQNDEQYAKSSTMNWYLILWL